MDAHESHPKRRKIYETPPQPTGLYTTSDRIPAEFQVRQQSEQGCLRSLLKSPNQGLTEHTQNKISSESVDGYHLPKQTITPDNTQCNKRYRNETNDGATVTVVMESGSWPSLTGETNYQAPRISQEEQTELEDINPTSLGQALRKELQKRAVAIQKVLSKHMVSVRSKISQLERENRELRQFAGGLERTLQDALKQQKPEPAQMVSRETQVDMVLENDLKVSRGTQVNMRIVFKPVLPEGKNVPIPRFLTGGLDGSEKSQFVHLTNNREPSSSRSVSNGTDHEHHNSNDKRSVFGKTVTANGSSPQTFISSMEGKPKNTTTAYRDVPSRDITTQISDIWVSKSTDQTDIHPRIDKVFSQAIGLPIARKPSLISSHGEHPYTPVDLNGQGSKTLGSKPTDSVSYHTSLDKASSQIEKPPVLVSVSNHRNASCGSMALKNTTIEKDEAPVKQVQNEAFYRTSPYSVITTNTAVSSVSEPGIERVSLLPKSPQTLPGALHGGRTNSISNVPPSPDSTSDGPQRRKDESSHLHNVTSGHSTSRQVLLTADYPERAPDSGPFSIQRLLSGHRPAKESPVTKVPSSPPPLKKIDGKNHKHPTGVTSDTPPLLKSGLVRENNPVKRTLNHNPESIQILDSDNEVIEVTSTPTKPPFLQGCDQRSSALGKSSNYTSTRHSTEGRHISHSPTTSLYRSSQQEMSAIHPAPLPTTSSNISPAVLKHKEPRQSAISSKESYSENLRPNTWTQQDPKSNVIKLSCENTLQKQDLSVATVQAMRSYSNSFQVISSVSSSEQLNTSRNNARPSEKKSNSTEGTGNIQRWHHKDPTIQEKRNFQESTASPLTPSNKSDLQAFVKYLTEAEISNTRSFVEEQDFATAFDIEQQRLLESHLTYFDSLQAQQLEIIQNQSKTVLTIQPGDSWKCADHSTMGMRINSDIHPGAIQTRKSLPSYDDNLLQNRSFFANKQYIPNVVMPYHAHYKPQNQYQNQQFQQYNRKQRGRPSN